MMNALDQGANPLFMNPNPDEAREFFARKSRAMTDKRMTEKEAVDRFIPDGCYLAIGGFGMEDAIKIIELLQSLWIKTAEYVNLRPTATGSVFWKGVAHFEITRSIKILGEGIYIGCKKTFRYSKGFFYNRLYYNSLFGNFIMESGIERYPKFIFYAKTKGF